METDFRSLIAGDPAVAALVAARIYPSTYAQAKDNPCVRYRKVTGTIGLHMRGSDGLGDDLMQIDVRALTALSAIAVKDAIIAKLHGFAGVSGNTEFLVIGLRDDRGVGFEKTDAEQFYTASLDFNVSWRRLNP